MMATGWIAMASATATGRRFTPSVHRIATFCPANSSAQPKDADPGVSLVPCERVAASRAQPRTDGYKEQHCAVAF
jgi:hypothetical protein